MAAPIGNKYAVGNRGGGAPLGNRNAWKHGGYARITWADVTAEERELVSHAPHDVDILIRAEIGLLLIRERRIMQRINRLAEAETVERVTVTREELREFDTDADHEEYEQRQRKKVDAGDKLPGKSYHLTTISEPAHDIILRWEDTLTHCQRRMLGYLSLLNGQHDNTTGAISVLEALEAWIHEGS